MSRRHRQLRVRDPDVFLLLPATPLAHRHARILRTIPCASHHRLFQVPRLSPRAARGAADAGIVGEKSLALKTPKRGGQTWEVGTEMLPMSDTWSVASAVRKVEFH